MAAEDGRERRLFVSFSFKGMMFRLSDMMVGCSGWRIWGEPPDIFSPSDRTSCQWLPSVRPVLLFYFSGVVTTAGGTCASAWDDSVKSSSLMQGRISMAGYGAGQRWCSLQGAAVRVSARSLPDKALAGNWRRQEQIHNGELVV